MFNLIRKDLLLHKTAFYGYTPVMVIYLAWLASQVSSRGAFIVFTCIMSAILPMVLITREEKFGAELFVCSLPVTRRQIVHAKYITCWMIALVLVMMGLVLYSIFAAQGRLEIWSVSTASRVLFALSLALGVALPFSLRFGWTGLIAGLVGMQLIGIISLLIAKNCSTNFRIKDVFIAFSEFIAGIHSQLGGPLFFVAVMIILTIFNLCSCKIVRLCLNEGNSKDLQHEQHGRSNSRGETMMLNLIRKDLLMHKTGFPVYVPFLAGVMALQAWRGFPLNVYIIMICIYAVIVPGALMAIEDRVRAGVFNCSLPVTRIQIARAKYVLAWALSLVAVLTGLVIFWIIRAQNAWAIWALSTANLALAILSIGLGLTLPFMLRLGWLGTMVFYFASMTLVFVTALIVLSFVPGRDVLDSFITCTEFVAKTAAQLGELNSLLLIVVAGTVLNLVSYKLAVMLFKRREF